MEAFEKIAELEREIDSRAPETTEELEQFRIEFLGSKNKIKPLFALIPTLQGAEKGKFGQMVNSMRQAAQDKYDGLMRALASKEEDSEGQGLDLSRPASEMRLGAEHPVTHTLNRIVEIFQRIGFQVAEDREIEDEWHNFGAMNTPENHPARDMQDTFYMVNDPQHLLRTHTSSVQARYMDEHKPPIRIVAPGRVYRNETISARSHCQFHQLEGLYVDEKVSFAQMKSVLLYFAQSLFGKDTKIRLRPSFFPFTEPSAEMDVYWGLENEVDYRMTKGTGWLEILGCGMVDPEVLENCGIDSEKYTGYAFGIGIERLTLFLYQIPDIRLLFENDVRFLRQFSSAL